MGVMEARRRILLNQPHLIDASGNPISFSTDMAAKMGVKAFFSPVQSGSGDPSPSNVRPISGWTGCTVSHSGTDMSNPTTYPVTFPAVGKNLCPNATGTSIAQNWVQGQYNYSKVISGLLPNQQYTLSCTITKADMGGGTQNRLYLQSGYINLTASNVPYVGAITRYSNDDGTIEISLNKSFANDSERAPYLTDIQLESGFTATSYEPFTNTLYGGYVDYERGEVVAEWASVDLGQYDWHKSGSGNKFYVLDITPYYPMISNLVMYCTDYKFDGANHSNIYYGDDGTLRYYFGIGGVAREIYVHDERFDNADDFKRAMSGVQLVYPRNTPIHYPLTPTLIKSLKGANTIWSDMNGNLEISYWKH